MQITHPIEPLYSPASNVLILGSFPSVKSREQQFFYGHPQNRFWRVISDVFGCVLPVTVDQKKALILNNRLALWDVIGSCEITGSSDQSIKNAVANPIERILRECEILKIFVNGKTAEKYYRHLIEPQLKISAVYLPSTSPANAAFSLERLEAAWRVIKIDGTVVSPLSPQ